MASGGGLRASWGSTGGSPTNTQGGSSFGGGGDGMSDRVARLETHFEYIQRDVSEMRLMQRQVLEKLEQLNDLPTKTDLWSWKIQYTALAVAVIAIVVGGIIGGLAWIQPAAQAPGPIVITVPGQSLPRDVPAN